jgi:hypothetical protein
MAESTKPKPANASDANYAVGYGRPPRQHQFKVGNTASRRGRKRGSRNRTLVIREILFEPIKVREGEDVKKMPLLEAIVRQTCNLALKGDHKAALMIIGLAQKEGLLTPELNEVLEENMSEADKAILADYKKRLNDSKV